MELLIPIFSVLGFFGATITYVYMKYRSRHIERMALIESGQTAEMLNVKKYNNGESSLRTGLFLIGGGIGFVIGSILETVLPWGEGQGIFPMTLIGAGIGLVMFYQRISKNKKEQDV